MLFEYLEKALGAEGHEGQPEIQEAIHGSLRGACCSRSVSYTHLTLPTTPYV